LRTGFNPEDCSGLGVFHTGTRCFDAAGWYAACVTAGMVSMFTAPALTLLFLGVVVGLGVAVVWMFWEIEQRSKPHRNG
jgi:hypothetical protein